MLHHLCYTEEDRRLFIGMIGKETTEDDLKAVFSTYGTIESCVILKERDGTSRGDIIQTVWSLNRSNLYFTD